jgi:two-component system CheB/CheR fusion protein
LPYRSLEEISGCVLTLIDLTNLKRAEMEAWTKDQQLSMILKNSPQPVVIKDLDGRYLLTNPNFDKLVGGNPIGRTAHELFDQRTADAIRALDERVVREGTTTEGEVEIPQADGPHTYLMVKFPLRDETGRIMAVGGIKTDVTRLKQAEQQTREAVEQRDRFLAVLSHELRNPLGAIASATQIIERLPLARPEQQEAVQVMDQQVTQMGRLLDDLLDIARITQDKIQLRRAAVQLDQLVGEAVRVVRPAFESARVALQSRVPNEPLVVMGDSARLQQMLVNLLLNGAKYTPAGGRVELSLAKEQGSAVVRISDTGMGIPADMLDKVFDLFVQGDDPLQRSSRGLGVGLTLVRRIADLHGGRVAAFSAGPNQGSEFVVHLPLGEVQQLSPPDGPGKPPAAPPMKVLVVEDNDDSRRMLETLLKLDGHEVHAARDGEEGLKALLRERPDLAFIDVGLPRLDGYELARRVRQAEDGKAAYLVALTGYGRAEDRTKVFAAGFDEHLVKPAKRGELDSILHRAQQRSSGGQHHRGPG